MGPVGRLPLGVCLLMRLISRFQTSTNATAVCAQEATKSAFHEFQLIPDVLDTAPEGNIQIVYQPGVRVANGNLLTPTQVKDAPMNVTWKADRNKVYTLLMVDPDVPSRAAPVLSELKHWLIVNVPGNDWKKGEVISAYLSPAPPAGSGPHRFVFLVFEQPSSGKMTFSEPRDPVTPVPSQRIRFSTKKFTAKYKLGNPVAGAFFQARWDSSVPPALESVRAFFPGITRAFSN